MKNKSDIQSTILTAVTFVNISYGFDGFLTLENVSNFDNNDGAKHDDHCFNQGQDVENITSVV